MHFVRCCDYSIEPAARRLLLYWNERQKLFGEDRAFLPMKLTGTGALTNSDVLQLKGGFPALLPKTTTGLQVAFYDRRQAIQTGNTVGTRARCMFYLAHLLAQEDDSSQTDGAVLLILLTMPRIHGYDKESTRKVWSLMKNVLPIKWKIHILNCLPKNPSKRYEVQDLISSYTNDMMDLGFGPDDTKVHFEREEGQLLRELMEMGLTREGIPVTLGGSWTFDSFARWCRDRAIDERIKEQQEMNTESASPRGTASPARASPTAAPALDEEGETLVRHPSFTGTSTSSQPMDDESRRTRLRASNVIHSRRKRDRRRQEFEDLKKERDELAAKHSLLKAEQSRLESFVQEANGIIQRREGAGAMTVQDEDGDCKPASVTQRSPGEGKRGGGG